MANADGVNWTIGVDEAGYGPNLGPLVVAASAWRADSPAPLEELLNDAVADTPEASGERLVIADSKKLYQPGGGLAALETAVLACVDDARSWRDLQERLRLTSDAGAPTPPWEEGVDIGLPIDAEDPAIGAARRLRQRLLGSSGVTSPRLAARIVHPLEFNRLVAAHGTKGAALSFVSIGLARSLADSIGATAGRTRFVFDKHGGRNRYGALLQEHFAEHWIETLAESRPESAYRVGERLSFRFRTRGEEEIAVGLASMTAKLMRELSMRAFNAYWAERVPGLNPTAGYPNDAKRFRAEIAECQHELGVPMKSCGERGKPLKSGACCATKRRGTR